MPVQGRKPKPQGQARHRVKSNIQWTEIPDAPYKGKVPTLPKRRDSKTWPERVKRKWAVWSRMPHCILWTPADWEFALDTIEIAAKFYEGDAKLATELRNREKLLGTTIDFRRDLRIRYIDPTVKEPATEDVINIDDYRERLG